MISTLNHIMLLIDDYESYLTARGVRFDKNGFPIPEQSWYLDERPELIVTYRERKSRLVRYPDKTVLCFFCADARIYPRLKNVLKELDVYRCFMGVIGPDVTVTPDMDVEWQRGDHSPQPAVHGGACGQWHQGHPEPPHRRTRDAFLSDQRARWNHVCLRHARLRPHQAG